MVKDLQKISEEKMLRSWALAETSNTKRWVDLDNQLPHELFLKIQQKKFDFSDEEWKKLVEIIKRFRSPLLNGLLPLGIEWYEGKISVDELGEIEMMNYPQFVKFAGSRRLFDFVKMYLKKIFPDEKFIQNLESIRENFKLSEMNGLPIILCEGINSHKVLLEGYTRICSILLNITEGKLSEKEIPIILGVSKRLKEWTNNDGWNWYLD